MRDLLKAEREHRRFLFYEKAAEKKKEKGILGFVTVEKWLGDPATQGKKKGESIVLHVLASWGGRPEGKKKTRHTVASC